MTTYLKTLTAVVLYLAIVLLVALAFLTGTNWKRFVPKVERTPVILPTDDNIISYDKDELEIIVVDFEGRVVTPEPEK